MTHPAALLCSFKNVNDTLGHAVGDILLQQVSGRLVRAVRSGDIARPPRRRRVVLNLEISLRRALERDEFQGYLFSRPVSPADCASRLANGRTRARRRGAGHTVSFDIVGGRR